MTKAQRHKKPAEARKFEITGPADARAAMRAAREMAVQLEFDEKSTEEIAIATSELGSNLARYAIEGILLITPLNNEDPQGIQLESHDRGPGIADVTAAFTDGYSTAGSLGYGMGTINRLMDDLEIHSNAGSGTHIRARRWKRSGTVLYEFCPLDFAVMTRAHPGMGVNGDAFIIRRWHNEALIGVIDGLGHGQAAHEAAEAARSYVENHYNQTLVSIFGGTDLACRATRGVVMSLIHFGFADRMLSFAGIGNAEVKAHGMDGTASTFLTRRGIVGTSAPEATVFRHHWGPGFLLALFSDGLRTHWSWEDFPGILLDPAPIAAKRLFEGLARENDDATLIIARSKDEHETA